MEKCVIKFERIHEDEEGAWPLDEYFSYIEAVADKMPPVLRAFATSISSYTLQGKESLHDSRVISFTVMKDRKDGGVSNIASVEVVFLDQMFEDTFSLRYAGVSSFLAAEDGLLSRYASDVLLHEFVVIAAGRYRHTVLFDGGGGYVVEFSEFSRRVFNDQTT
jgi:hypothetical protein